jgi:hypothetical protein
MPAFSFLRYVAIEFTHSRRFIRGLPSGRMTVASWHIQSSLVDGRSDTKLTLRVTTTTQRYTSIHARSLLTVFEQNSNSGCIYKDLWLLHRTQKTESYQPRLFKRPSTRSDTWNCGWKPLHSGIPFSTHPRTCLLVRHAATALHN